MILVRLKICSRVEEGIVLATGAADRSERKEVNA
jgi:hypothetical protein